MGGKGSVQGEMEAKQKTHEALVALNALIIFETINQNCTLQGDHLYKAAHAVLCVCPTQ